MSRSMVNLILARLTAASVLLFFAVLIYLIFGRIAEFNYDEAKGDCQQYYGVGREDAQVNHSRDRCLDDAQSTRQTTSRIGGVAGIILAIMAVGAVLQGIKNLLDTLAHRVQLL